MPDFVRDASFALRLLRKSPVSTVVALVSLSLGIGATTGVFALIDALLLRPLPAVRAPAELVSLAGFDTKQPARLRPLSWADYLDGANHSAVVSGLAAAADCTLSLTRRGPAERISGLAVSTNYFNVLGLRPALGRFFLPAETTAPVAILGYGLWQRQFGSDPAAIGSAVRLNGKSVTIVGVAPKGFLGTDLGTRHEVWLPLETFSTMAAGVLVPFSGRHDRQQEWLTVVGRLAPGMSPRRAQSAFDRLAADLAAAYPASNAQRGLRVLPLAETVLGPEGRPLILRFSRLLSIVMALVLAVVSLNVAGLLLARAVSRRREIAIRLSLGASRGRLLRQLFSEGIVLGLLGAAGGIGLAMAGLPLFEKLDLPVRLAVRDLRISGPVLGFTLLVTLASTLAFALLPALAAVRTDAVASLRGEMPRGRRLRFGLSELLVGSQVALTLLILIAAGLMLRTVANLGRIDPGFDPKHVLMASVDLTSAGYQGPRTAAFYGDLLSRLRSLPEVEEASMASALPVMGGDLEVDLTVTVEDASASAGASPASGPSVRHVLVGDRYFETVKARLLRGRVFGPEDGASGPGAVILNQAAARRLWRGRDPLGRRLRLLQSETPFVVVGIVADATYARLKEEAPPVLYLAHAQAGKSFIGELLAPQMTLLARTVGDPRRVLGKVREAVRALDPRLPVYNDETLEQHLASTVGVERQAAMLYAGLALLAMLLALLGLYGILTQAVIERTQEIAVRAACGAGPGEVRRLILMRCLAVTLAGVAVGLAAALPVNRILENQIYGVEATDPLTWLGAAFVLLSLALLVSLSPARRAARISPSTVLRHH